MRIWMALVAVPSLPSDLRGPITATNGLTATVVYHQFDSDVGDIDYGTEWDAPLLGGPILPVFVARNKEFLRDRGARGRDDDGGRRWPVS